jgi:hypothetical protein
MEQTSEEALALTRFGGRLLVLLCRVLQFLFLDASLLVVVR